MGAVSVIASEISPRDFTDRFTALGTAHAAESIQVTARITSVISRINFSEGQDVPAGQLLVELDSKEIRADLAVAEASLQQSRSVYERSHQLADTRVISQSQLEELEAKMTRLGRQTRAIEIKYAHLPAVATAEKKATNREYLVVGWDEATLRKRGLSTRTEPVARRTALPAGASQ